MPAQSEAYKCMVCGAVVAVLTGGKGKLASCDRKMAAVTPDKAKN